MTGRIIHLLRHGPPVREGLLLGHADEPVLDPNCPVMLARIRELPLTAIVSSDLSRAALQAATLSKHLGLPLTLASDWRELDFGLWNGADPCAVDRKALARFWDDPQAFPPPQGELWSSLRSRVRRALTVLETQTLVLTHAGTMRAAVSVLTGLDHRGVWALELPYRALLTLRTWPDLTGQVIGLRGAER